MALNSFLENESLIRDIAAASTQRAAEACFKHIGRLDETAADRAAVDAMRRYLNNSAILGRVVIGEGERDKAPMLYCGEALGTGNIEVDIAVDPLEGTTICAEGGNGALSVIVMGQVGSLLEAPDVYMEKIAVGITCQVDLRNPVEENIKILAKAKGCHVSDISVAVLKRPRHTKLIENISLAGAKVLLISDGDIAAVISTRLLSSDNNAPDMYIGIGGAPEGVIAAAALRCIGGKMQGRLLVDNEAESHKGNVLEIGDMVKSGAVVAMTGVTSGNILKGVKLVKNFETQSLVFNTMVFGPNVGTYNKITSCVEVKI